MPSGSALDDLGTTPLIKKMQDLSKQAKKAGYPRAENGQEMMTDRAQERAAGTGASTENQLYHGRPEGRKSVGSHGRAGKFGLEVS
jgi:hypothetical protein